MCDILAYGGLVGARKLPEQAKAWRRQWQKIKCSNT